MSRARQALALAKSIDEVKDIRDKAEALRAYAKQVGMGLEMQNECAEIKLRAERRAGEMLGEMGIKPGNPQLSHDAIIERPTLSALGINLSQSHRWQLERSVPDEVFEKFVAETKAEAEELTSRGVLAIALRIKRQNDIKNVPPFPAGKYQVLYADPPWAYDNTGLGGSAESHYPTLPASELETLKDSTSLQVTELAGDNAVLFLWVTSPFLPEGLELCQAWGFDYKTSFVWIKDRTTYGKLGFYNYGQHEFLFVATRGSCLPRSESLVPSLIVAPKGEHSAKPELVYEIIEKMYPGPYIELFARKTRPNWATWGTL
ncbi:hypothetical protein ES703_90843 [subsurface metagenome]